MCWVIVNCGMGAVSFSLGGTCGCPGTLNPLASPKMPAPGLGHTAPDGFEDEGRTVAVDLTGGLGDEREYVFATQPDDPEMRESVNAWIWGAGGDVGMPRIGVEALAEQWNDHDVQVNIAFSDGRVCTLHGSGTKHDPAGADGKARTLGAGPLSFELIEPFTHWRMHLDGMGHSWTNAQQATGARPDGDPTVPVHAEIDIRSAAPPWENGELLAEAKRVLEEQDEGALMGGPRFEQLSRATGHSHRRRRRASHRGGCTAGSPSGGSPAGHLPRSRLAIGPVPQW